MANTAGSGGERIRESWEDHRRRRRVVGIVLSGRGRDRRRPGSGRGRGPRQHSGRRAFRRYAQCDGRHGRLGSGLDRGSRRAAVACDRRRLQPHARRGHDRSYCGTVRRRPIDTAQYRQLAGERNRPNRRDGDRTLQAWCACRGRSRLVVCRAAREVRARHDRYLRRSPDRDVFLARHTRRDIGAHQRSAVRAQDLPRILRRVPRPRPMTDAAPVVIAVDGPAASGKGTIAQGVARTLGFHYLDSGSLYRLVALKALEAGIALDDEPGLAQVAETLNSRFVDGRIMLDGVDASAAVRTEAVGAAASRVAVVTGVRRALLARQRAFRRSPGLVADGRDMGTVVFPDAALKIYITASPEERASRRYKQLIEKGISVTLDSLLRDIRERDDRDSSRAAAPLKPAADAIILDTTGLTIEAGVAFVLERYRELRLEHGH